MASKIIARVVRAVLLAFSFQNVSKSISSSIERWDSRSQLAREMVRELNRQKSQERTRKYKSGKWKRRPVFDQRLKFHYRSIRPQDKRFSNQRSLRRMFRNG